MAKIVRQNRGIPFTHARVFVETDATLNNPIVCQDRNHVYSGLFPNYVRFCTPALMETADAWLNELPILDEDYECVFGENSPYQNIIGILEILGERKEFFNARSIITKLLEIHSVSGDSKINDDWDIVVIGIIHALDAELAEAMGDYKHANKSYNHVYNFDPNFYSDIVGKSLVDQLVPLGTIAQRLSRTAISPCC